MELTSFTAGEDRYREISRQDVQNWKDVCGWEGGNDNDYVIIVPLCCFMRQ